MLFSTIPIRDAYKVPHPESIVLLAKPSTIRLCVFIEIASVLAVFIFSFYYTATTGSTETRITFETLGDPYVCSILAPRKDMEEFNTDVGEIAAFSSVRYTDDECLYQLGSDGLDVCSDAHREDYYLSLTGISIDSSVCKEINLHGGTRLCLTTEKRTVTGGAAAETFFKDSSEDLTYTKIIPSTSYFFADTGGIFHTITSTFELSEENPYGEILSDFVVGDNNEVYVAAIRVDSEMSMYRLSKSNSSSVWLHSITAPPTGLSGVTYGKSCVFTYYLSSGNKLGTIVRYNTTSKVVTEANAVNCTGYMTNDGYGGSDVRWISYGTDGYLYALCTTSAKTVIVNGQLVLPVVQVDPVSLTTRKVFFAPINAVIDSGTGLGIDTVAQVFQVGASNQLIILTTIPVFGIVEGRTTQVQNFPGGVTFLSGLQLRSTYQGNYGLVISPSLIYFTGQTNRAYNITSQSLVTFDSDIFGQRYWATRTQFGYSYQVCNGNYTHFVVDVDVSNTFYKQCQEDNGIYFQTSSYFNVPTSCKSYINSTEHTLDILNCPDMITMREGYLKPNCMTSINVICEVVYEDNPPFSCERTTYPSYIGVTATALANASGAWSLIFLLIKIALRKTHFHYVHDFEYDKSKERYFNRNTGKIHTKSEYLAAEVEKGEAAAMQSAFELSPTDTGTEARQDSGQVVRLDKERSGKEASPVEEA